QAPGQNGKGGGTGEAPPCDWEEPPTSPKGRIVGPGAQQATEPSRRAAVVRPPGVGGPMALHPRLPPQPRGRGGGHPVSSSSPAPSSIADGSLIARRFARSTDAPMAPSTVAVVSLATLAGPAAEGAIPTAVDITLVGVPDAVIAVGGDADVPHVARPTHRGGHRTMTAPAVGIHVAVSKVVTGCAGGPTAVNVGLVLVLETVGTCGRRDCAIRDVEDEDAAPAGAVSVESAGWSSR